MGWFCVPPLSVGNVFVRELDIIIYLGGTDLRVTGGIYIFSVARDPDDSVFQGKGYNFVRVLGSTFITAERVYLESRVKPW